MFLLPGHKEFHTASLHFSQMLYIWPYFFFFSWPLILFPLVNLLLPNTYVPKFLNYGFPKKQKGLPALLTILVVVPIMLLIVHFNTIVHPFTLADNRHYIFYVFRILLGYHWAVKYFVVLIYFICAWAVISAFGFSTIAPPPRLMQVPSSPPVAPTKSEQKESKKKQKTSRRAVSTKKANPNTDMQPISPEVMAKIQAHILQRQRGQLMPPRVSFVLVWLVSTALSLVTAPLVEPRYFIIPWVMWRIHLPPQPTLSVYRQQCPSGEMEITRAKFVQNIPIFLETLWFLFINAVTGYVFLYEGFEWPQEPGKVQRFMW